MPINPHKSKMKISHMKTWSYRKQTSAVLIPLLLLAGCFGGEPPSAKDVAAIATKHLLIANAVSGWKPVDVQVSNLKCNRSGEVYACSFDVQGKMRRTEILTREVKVNDFSNTDQTGKFIKAGEVWTATL